MSKRSGDHWDKQAVTDPRVLSIVTTGDSSWREAYDSLRADPETFENWEALVTATDALASSPGSQPEVATTVRSVFDALLSKFPLMFGYWLQYAQLEARLAAPSAPTVIQVYERAVCAFPNSIELWTSYLDHAAESGLERPKLKHLYLRALNHVGRDFLAHDVWDRYLAFEDDTQEKIRMLKYLTSIPMHQYARYLEEYRNLSGEELPQEVVEATARRTNERWAYESLITRNYFHVLPVEDEQYDNWRNYLAYSVANEKDLDDTRALFERALVPCALYEEIWLLYIKWAMDRGCPEDDVSAIFQKASEMVSISRPFIRLQWSLYAELIGDIQLARQILRTLESSPILTEFKDEINIHRAHFERRQSIDGAIDFLSRQKSTNAVYSAMLAVIYWKDKSNPGLAYQTFDETFEKHCGNRCFLVNYFYFVLDQETDESKLFTAWKGIVGQSPVDPVLIADISMVYMDHLLTSSSPLAMKYYMAVDAETNGPLVCRDLWKQKLGPNTELRLWLENGHPGVEVDPLSNRNPSKNYNEPMTRNVS